ncbi:monocarboxylate transporter 9 [Schistocerca cancellata]|uniref:monocarboxylate transporter 9 n=1 Tax=Schistocerca cancellata TaxID=274614 RepID=UPI00211995F2|nr:monocarboxylate transporter 9 [Schistocerca cancellata]
MTHAPAPKKRSMPSPGTEAAAAPADVALPPEPVPPPDGGWGWVVVFASFMIHIVTDGVTYSFGVLYVEFLDAFKEGKGATALIASILVGVTFCSGPISSSFVNKYGCRPVTIAGAILASASLAVSVFARNVLTLYFTIGIGTGLGFGLIYLPAIVSVTCYFEKYRSLATGIAVCGSGLGTFLFAPLTDALLTHLAWRGALLAIAGFVLSCVLFGALFRPLQSSEPAAEDVPIQQITTGNLRSAEEQAADAEEKRPMMQRSGSAEALVGGAAAARAGRLAQSQPALQLLGTGAATPHHPHPHHQYQQLHGVRRAPSAGGLMQRKDILYSGSLHNIPLHHRSANLLSEQKKVSSNNHLPPAYVAEPAEEQHEKSTICGCIPCSPEAKETWTEMLDFSLLKDVIFILFAASNFLTSIGFNIPYVYIVVQAEKQGISKESASYLLSAVGIANTVGRVLLGYISDKPWVNRLYIYNGCLAICGIATAMSVLCHDFYSMAVYCCVFGFTIGAYVGLTSVILVDLLGLDKLTNAFGILLLFEGVASLLGPPIAGWLYDELGSYDPGFYVSGVTIALSGLMLFVIPSLQRRQNLRSQEAEC